MRAHLPLLLSLAGLSLAAPAHARGPGKTVAKLDPDWQSAPSARYAALEPAACHAELNKRGVSFSVVADAPGVRAPVRVPDGINGVRYRTDLPREQGKTSPWEVFDCRLVVALHDFSEILVAHGIDEVRIFSSWRPPGKKWPKDKLAKRHPGGLAVDIRTFRKKPVDGAPERWIAVVDHWGGKVGGTTCGDGASAPNPPSAEAAELRAIVCAAADKRLFTSILTPHYDRAHHNHFHLDLAPGVKWRIVR